jgi:hypothetical protein
VKNNFYLLGSTSHKNSDEIVTLHAYVVIDVQIEKEKTFIKIKNLYNNHREYSKQLRFSKNGWNNTDGIFRAEFDKSLLSARPTNQ